MVVNKNGVLYVVSLLFVLLYSINIIGYGELLPLLGLPFCAIVIYRNKFSKLFLLSQFTLIFFLGSYCLFSIYFNYYNSYALMGKLIFPPTLLLIGYIIAGLDTPKKHRSFLIIITMVMGSLIYGVGSLLKSIINFGSYYNVINILGGRVIQDLWGDSLVSSTVLNASLSLGLGLLGVVFLKSKINIIRNRLIKIAIFLMFISCFITSATLGNRTGILISFLSLITVLLIKFKWSFQNLLIIMSAILSFYLMKILIFNSNILGIKVYLENTFIYKRFLNSDINGDPRFEAWSVILTNFKENIFGGRQIDIKLNFVHSFWLDVYYDAGIIPFMLLVVFTALSIITLLKFLKLSSLPSLYKGLVVGLFTAFFITFSVEPILQGFTVYFTFFCLFIGIIQRKLTLEIN